MRGQDTLLVQQRERFRGSAGQAEYRNAGDPVAVRCNVYMLDTVTLEQYGEKGQDTRQVVYHGRSWPGDIHSEITFEGGSWYQLDPAQYAGKGVATKHWEIVIRKR